MRAVGGGPQRTPSTAQPRSYAASWSSPSSPASSRCYSPLPSPVYQKTCMSAAAKRYKYLRRLLHVNQMDFEFALWQMFYLFSNPQRVFRDFVYRKSAKSQYARDDPAFFVLLMAWMVLSSVMFAAVFRASLYRSLIFLLSLLFINCIGLGILIATVLWVVVNKYLRRHPNGDEDVEWGYAFDIHLNAFFPPLVILHVFQVLFYIIFHEAGMLHIWLVGLVIGNTFWLLGIGYYIYITFLGYKSVAILRDTQYLLTPMPVLGLLYLLSILLGWNFGSYFIHFYSALFHIV
ncbi:unnamed protein product [Cyprideis torosa]|uniref:Uncharacterized protein n=1 Tax=Cyprideis torosa TaxID=163714 RepID=A0A7R8W6X7_9CRUS|nr:unnamed protein product [Cyprideis torosa]CAG0887004.1 unnamed protein product [Cyprideis torosa]